MPAEYLAPTEDDLEERQEIDQIAPSALAILNRSEHAQMVQTANYPANRRKLGEFESKLKAYATHTPEIALLMFYSLPRAGKQIIGPSVRFAEIVAPCWKNCAVASRVIGDSANTVTAQGIFIDYEANLRNSIEVPRRITDKNNNRYSDDMIITTSNAAMSVARRNAVLKGGVPQALWSPAYAEAQLTAVGKAASHAQRIADAMEYLHKLGVTEWQILNAVGVPGIKELETEHLVTLRVLCQEIKRGDKTIEEVFGSNYDKEIDALFVQLKMNQAQQTMLKNSYLGRAEKLVEYLRERLGPAAIEETVAQKSTPALKRLERKPEPAASVNPVNENAESPLTIEETVAQKSTPAFNAKARQEAAEKELQERDRAALSEVRADLRAEAPADLPPFDAPTLPRGQSISQQEAPRRRAGRPSREEMARRAAQQQGTLMPQPEPSEQDERAQAERVIEQTDQFSF